VIGKGRGRNGLRLNTEKQILWISYDICQEKEEGKAELEKMGERECKIIQHRCVDETGPV
jgi:urease gamma subunit